MYLQSYRVHTTYLYSSQQCLEGLRKANIPFQLLSPTLPLRDAPLPSPNQGNWDSALAQGLPPDLAQITSEPMFLGAKLDFQTGQTIRTPLPKSAVLNHPTHHIEADTWNADRTALRSVAARSGTCSTRIFNPNSSHRLA